MATGLKTKAKAAETKAARAVARRVLYLYAISRKPKAGLPRVTVEGIDGEAGIDAIPVHGYICWIGRVAREEFAERLAEQMENLEWLASAGLRHQRAVAAITEKVVALPARFGTVFLGEPSLNQHVRERKRALDEAFERVADADEWGVKVFRVATPRPQQSPSAAPVTGVEYLKRKAQSRQSIRGTEVDDQILSLARQLDSLAVASSPGGKASEGQPGLLWHGSFLIRRKDRKKLETLLSRFATKWHHRLRIDWSGPWPPYSFVGQHAE